MSELVAARGKRRAAFAFIFVTIFLDMMALGIVIPVLPRLVLDFMGGDPVRGAEMFGLFGTVWSLMQFFTMPIAGALSDRFGRRPVILISSVGLCLDYVLMALAPNLAWLLVGRMLSGITAASFSTGTAYIADVTPPEKRAGAFGMIGIAFGLGFVLGPAIGGVLGAEDPRLPFWFAAGFGLLNFIYGVFVLPESLGPESRAPFRWSRANPVASLGFLRERRGLLPLVAITFLGHLAHIVLPSTFVLYAAYRFDWDARASGLALAGVGLCSAIVQGGLIRPAVAWLGERGAMLCGLGAGAIGFLTYGLATTGAMFCVGIPIMALWGLAGPATQGLMTRKVGPQEQGRLQGTVSSLMGIAGMMGPGLFTQTYAYFIAPEHGMDVPGAPFFLSSALLALSAGVAFYAARPTPGEGLATAKAG